VTIPGARSNSSLEYTQLVRVVRSLLAWSEVPARTILNRGDHPRFAHAMATTARQLGLASRCLHDAREHLGGGSHAGSDKMDSGTDRIREMMSLRDLTASASLADELVTDMLSQIVQFGGKEATERLGRWNGEPVSRTMSLDGVQDLAHTIFERARTVGALAVLVADSWARGLADDSSDIDVRLVVVEQPTLIQRYKYLRPIVDDTRLRQYGDEAYITADQFVLYGRKIDVKYHTVNRIRSALGRPFELGGPVDLLELLQTHIIVSDHAGRFTEIVAATPAALQTRAREVARVSVAALRELDASLVHARNHVEAASTILGPGLEYMARAWTGFNGHVHAFPKWLELTLREMAGPPAGMDRLHRLCTEPWDKAEFPQRISEWRNLVNDIAALDHATT
jgi:hypothetical protein